MKNQKLVAARKQKCWSIQKTAEETAVSWRTYQRWEHGTQHPHLFNLDRLSKAFGKLPEDLGFSTAVEVERGEKACLTPGDMLMSSQISHQSAPTLFEMGMLLLSMAKQQQHWSINALLAHIEPALKGYLMEEQDREIARRQVLKLLVGLPPALFGLQQLGNTTPLSAEEVLPFCVAGMSACWSLSKGNELSVVERSLSSYLSSLVTIVQQSSKHQSMAASLASQGYQIACILALQQNRLKDREAYGKQAIEYGQLAGDPNLLVAAMILQAGTYYHAKHPTKTLRMYQETLPYIGRVTPLLQGRVYVGLAEAYARCGQKQEALTHLGLAYDTFPQHPENDPSFDFADCSFSSLFLWDGRTRLELDQPDEALQTFNNLQNLKNISERTRIAIINHQAEASVILGDLEQSRAYVIAGRDGAVALGSEKRYNEAYGIYQQMRILWRNDPRVKELADLFVR